jgi:hypothetical protein
MAGRRHDGGGQAEPEVISLLDDSDEDAWAAASTKRPLKRLRRTGDAGLPTAASEPLPESSKAALKPAPWSRGVQLPTATQQAPPKRQGLLPLVAVPKPKLPLQTSNSFPRRADAGPGGSPSAAATASLSDERAACGSPGTDSLSSPAGASTSQPYGSQEANRPQLRQLLLSRSSADRPTPAGGNARTTGAHPASQLAPSHSLSASQEARAPQAAAPAPLPGPAGGALPSDPDRSQQAMWCERYAPASEEELATVLHYKKVRELRDWMLHQLRLLGCEPPAGAGLAGAAGGSVRGASQAAPAASQAPPPPPPHAAPTPSQSWQPHATGAAPASAPRPGPDPPAPGGPSVPPWQGGRPHGPAAPRRQACGLAVLVGPAGCGKSAAVRALAGQLGFQLLEWTPPPHLAWAELQYQVGWPGRAGRLGCHVEAWAVDGARGKGAPETGQECGRNELAAEGGAPRAGRERSGGRLGRGRRGAMCRGCSREGPCAPPPQRSGGGGGGGRAAEGPAYQSKLDEFEAFLARCGTAGGFTSVSMCCCVARHIPLHECAQSQVGWRPGGQLGQPLGAARPRVCPLHCSLRVDAAGVARVCMRARVSTRAGASSPRWRSLHASRSPGRQWVRRAALPCTPPPSRPPRFRPAPFHTSSPPPGRPLAAWLPQHDLLPRPCPRTGAVAPSQPPGSQSPSSGGGSGRPQLLLLDDLPHTHDPERRRRLAAVLAGGAGWGGEEGRRERSKRLRRRVRGAHARRPCLSGTLSLCLPPSAPPLGLASSARWPAVLIATTAEGSGAGGGGGGGAGGWREDAVGGSRGLHRVSEEVACWTWRRRVGDWGRGLHANACLPVQLSVRAVLVAWRGSGGGCGAPWPTMMHPFGRPRGARRDGRVYRRSFALSATAPSLDATAPCPAPCLPQELLTALESAGAWTLPFNPATPNAIARLLLRVAADEGLVLAPGAAVALAEAAGGDIRAALQVGEGGRERGGVVVCVM